MNTTPIIAERQLTNIVSLWLGLTVDVDAFRGQFPLDDSEGVCVTLGGRIARSSLDAPMYEAQIFGRYIDRDNAQNMLAKIFDHLPTHGIRSENVEFMEIDALGNGTVYIDVDDGLIKHRALAKLRVVYHDNPTVLTS